MAFANSPLVVPREGGASSSPRRSLFTMDVSAYWITRMRG
jgi:hypothetical protein